jgi:hypothetical protein
MTHGDARRPHPHAARDPVPASDPVVALWREWRAASEEVLRLIRDEVDVDPDRRGELDAACGRLDAIEGRLAGARASSLAGAAAKLRVALANLDPEGAGDDPQVRLLTSALADLDRLLERA